jgi:VanZ family protein
MILRITYFTAMAAVLSTIVLLVLTHIPGKALPHFVRFDDKQLHYTGYAILSLLYGVTVAKKGWRGLLYLFLTAVFVAALAAADEYTQQYFGRTTDIKDYYADLKGIATGIGVSLIYWMIKSILAIKFNVKISK